MKPGSDFDSVHLFCEKHKVWTNLRGVADGSHCLDDDTSKRNNTHIDEKGEGNQLSLF